MYAPPKASKCEYQVTFLQRFNIPATCDSRASTRWVALPLPGPRWRVEASVYPDGDCYWEKGRSNQYLKSKISSKKSRIGLWHHRKNKMNLDMAEVPYMILQDLLLVVSFLGTCLWTHFEPNGWLRSCDDLCLCCKRDQKGQIFICSGLNNAGIGLKDKNTTIIIHHPSFIIIHNHHHHHHHHHHDPPRTSASSFWHCNCSALAELFKHREMIWQYQHPTGLNKSLPQNHRFLATTSLPRNKNEGSPFSFTSLSQWCQATVLMAAIASMDTFWKCKIREVHRNINRNEANK